ncbi:cytochrome P450 [Aspergillus saccharolyticus JOP 1030-1]|uniref:Cytochrome protein n=1 Tax=Aspergillus saccharolyticus JOP 1030-1 TaxID=1450539 RepID=A0A318ZDZ1_9EURO|nr:cytochrome protein [Aspergillus saccharolyticus JOP 1030-1]PYH41760.1 cytochrome protein [Aspergillus saccharolyticus JOP 1030-1]
MHLLLLLSLPILSYLSKCIIHLFYTTWQSPSLTSIPGPFLARFTRLWYFSRVWKGHFETDNLDLHARYGPVVRIAPGHYSISERTAVKTVYGTGSRFPKSSWYEGWKHPSPDRWTLFTDRNIKRHSETRKRFSSLYSMSSLLHYEEFADQCAEIVCERLTEFAQSGQTFDLHYWLQCYAFDVIGDITFGQRFGFLDKGEDIEGAIAALQKVMAYSTLVGIYPEWHPRVYEPLSRFTSTGPAGRSFIMRFVAEKIHQLNEQRKTQPSQQPQQQQDPTPQRQDFLEKMAIARDKDPEKVTDYHLFMMGNSNIIAGSDTTAISLSAILYHLLRNPAMLARLRQEVDEFTAQGRCSARVTFKESQAMPYLQAVMKEALRMHSATGLPLWREVPAGGAEISGRFFPEGSVVGVNTWVAHYDEGVFPDAKSFRPERWIEAEKDDPTRLQMMNEMYMPFGLGSRTCLGKHISILEMSKLIPQMIRDFEFRLEKRTWDTDNKWFVKPLDFHVKVAVRAKAAG